MEFIVCLPSRHFLKILDIFSPYPVCLGEAHNIFFNPFLYNTRPLQFQYTKTKNALRRIYMGPRRVSHAPFSDNYKSLPISLN